MPSEILVEHRRQGQETMIQYQEASPTLRLTLASRLVVSPMHTPDRPVVVCKGMVFPW